MGDNLNLIAILFELWSQKESYSEVRYTILSNQIPVNGSMTLRLKRQYFLFYLAKY